MVFFILKQALVSDLGKNEPDSLQGSCWREQ
jgi:hypothetical protein